MNNNSANDSGRVLLFTGDGKGKTTAAIGMAFRAAGHGMKTLVVQFIKGKLTTGEVRVGETVAGIEIAVMGKGFLPRRTQRADGTPNPRLAGHVEAAQQALERAAEALRSGDYDLVVLDEVCNAVAKGVIDESAVIAAVGARRPGVHVVLTGRNATPGLIACADTATEMRCLKHAYASGRRAEQGVEF